MYPKIIYQKNLVFVQEYLKLSIFTFENGNVLKEKKYGALNLSMINEKVST